MVADASQKPVTEPASPNRCRREAKIQLDNTVVGIELTLISIIQGLCWWLVHAYPQALLHDGWHLLLIGLTLVFSVNYLYGGVRLLRRRQDWILARAAQERAEA